MVSHVVSIEYIPPFEARFIGNLCKNNSKSLRVVEISICIYFRAILTIPFLTQC